MNRHVLAFRSRPAVARVAPWASPVLLAVAAMLAMAALTACGQAPTDLFQGYVEGEFVYVAAPLGGQLETLSVDKGQRVPVGAPLFALEREFERAAVDDAAMRLRGAEDTLADRRKGQRPTELDSARARLKQSEASQALADLEFKRRADLLKKETISQDEYDRARTDLDLARQRARQDRADLSTAQLGSREDTVRAAEADVASAKARLDQARWSLEQKAQAAPVAGLVFDVIQRAGEWVGAGKPVVSLLPPQNVKIRFFVPQAALASLAPGQEVQVSLDGGAPFAARITFISPQAEYTPPVIYSSQSRAKLVFLIEARPAPEAAAGLHPGQPVDVRTLPPKDEVKKS